MSHGGFNMPKNLRDIPYIGNRKGARLAKLGLHTVEDMQSMKKSDLLIKLISEMSIGKSIIKKMFVEVDIELTDKDIDFITRAVKNKKEGKPLPPYPGEPSLVDVEKYGIKGTKSPIPSFTDEEAKDAIDAFTKKAVPDISEISGKSDLEEITLKTKDEKLKIKKVHSKYDKTTDFTDFADDERLNFTTVKESIMKAAEAHSDYGSRTHVTGWINLLRGEKDSEVDFNEQSFTDFEYVQPILSGLLDVLIRKVQGERSSGNIYGDESIILYKIFVDAVGSNWDGTPHEGVLGIDDYEEFNRRVHQKTTSTPQDLIDRAWTGYQTGTSLLLAGDPGSGKTYFAKIMGNAITDNLWSDIPYSRANIHAGIEPEDLMGTWDYQAQILAMSAAKIRIDKLESVDESDIEALRENLYQEEYFHYGPLALAMIQGIPILIDEVNRANPDVQNVLLQAIDERELILSNIGRVKAAPGFFVMFTINEDDVGTQPLSQAFLRRVKYIPFEMPDDFTQFIVQEFPNWTNKKLLRDIRAVRDELIKHVEQEIPPSAVSAWAQELISMFGPDLVLDKTKIITTLGTLIKNKEDMDTVMESINEILSGFPEHAEPPELKTSETAEFAESSADVDYGGELATKEDVERLASSGMYTEYLVAMAYTDIEPDTKEFEPSSFDSVLTKSGETMTWEELIDKADDEKGEVTLRENLISVIKRNPKKWAKTLIAAEA